MTGTQSARIWMLLKSEMSLGLKSVPWRLKAAAPRSAPARADVAQAAAIASPQSSAIPRPTVARPAPAEPIRSDTRKLELSVNPASMLTLNTTEPFTQPILSLDQRQAILGDLDRTQVKVCTKCVLHETRTHTVFGEGSLEAQLMFIGEGPGEDEDKSGRPFVGRSGQLLGKMITAMGLSREQVYIANIVKCRPPGNRTPQSNEVATCTPYLLKQMEVIRPKVIVTLGLPATQFMLQVDKPMRDLRGVWQVWRGIKLMPTYHPSYVLRSYTPNVRGAVWSDLQMVIAELGLPPKSQMA